MSIFLLLLLFNNKEIIWFTIFLLLLFNNKEIIWFTIFLLLLFNKKNLLLILINGRYNYSFYNNSSIILVF